MEFLIPLLIRFGRTNFTTLFGRRFFYQAFFWFRANLQETFGSLWIKFLQLLAFYRISTIFYQKLNFFCERKIGENLRSGLFLPDSTAIKQYRTKWNITVQKVFPKLKIPRGKTRTGSSPVSGTKKSSYIAVLRSKGLFFLR